MHFHSNIQDIFMYFKTSLLIYPPLYLPLSHDSIILKDIHAYVHMHVCMCPIPHGTQTVQKIISFILRQEKKNYRHHNGGTLFSLLLRNTLRYKIPVSEAGA